MTTSSREQPRRPLAFEALVRDAFVEAIPLTSAREKLASIPRRTTVTITCSAKLGLERTLEFTALAAQAGHRVVPHLAARQLTGEPELRNFVGRLADLGVTDLYVVGGDAAEPAGPYRHTADLLEALTGIDHTITSIGVACYPEGHPSIPVATLTDGLRRAQQHAHYMVSQLCFDEVAISTWLRGVRADGMTLPLHLGIAGPLQLRKLVELSLRIGVGASVRYLTKQHGFVGNVLRGSSYRPEQLLEELGDTLTDPIMGIDRLHLFTFNQISESVDWQARLAG